MPLPAIIGIASMLYDLVLSNEQANAQEKKDKEMKEYEARIEAQTKKEIADRNRERRMAAISRAIGNDIPFIGKDQEMPIKKPDPLDTSEWDKLRTISSLIGTTASLAGNAHQAPETYSSTWDRPSTQPSGHQNDFSNLPGGGVDTAIPDVNRDMASAKPNQFRNQFYG